MRTRRIAGTSLLAAGLMLGTSGCGLAYLMAGARQNAVSGGASSCSNWASAMASPAAGDTKDAGESGEPTQIDAVTKAAAAHQEPASGWGPVDDAAPEGQQYASGPFTIHVRQLPDGTWFADSGGSCATAFGTASPTATAVG